MGAGNGGATDGAATADFQRRPDLERWFRTDLGRALLEAEARLLAEPCREHAIHRLLLGMVDATEVAMPGDCYHSFSLAPTRRGGSHGCVSAYEALPLPENSMDTIVVQNVLEFADQPHQILREAERILAPGGRLLVLVLNPWSLLGLKAWGQYRLGATYWRMQRISAHRLHDWMSLLGLAVRRVRYDFYQLPIDHPRLLRLGIALRRRLRPASFPVGGVYLMEATKETIPLTPVRPRRASWRSGFAAPLAHGGLPASKSLH